MNKTLRFLAVPTLALGALALSGSPAMALAQSPDPAAFPRCVRDLSAALGASKSARTS